MKNTGKKLLVGLATTSLLMIPGLTGAEKGITYTDVEKSNSHYDAIMELTESGVVNGYPAANGTREYRPHDELQRDHTAVMFTRILDLTIPEDVSEVLKDFVDVDENTRYAEQIAATVKERIFNGNSSTNEYMPLEDLTRQQMATVLVNAFGLEKKDESVDINLKNVASSHKENVQILADNGVTDQLEDYRPMEPVTRGQFATFLIRATEAVNKVEEEPTPEPTPEPEEPELPEEEPVFEFDIPLEVFVGDRIPLAFYEVKEDGTKINRTSDAKFELYHLGEDFNPVETNRAIIEDGHIEFKQTGSVTLKATYGEYEARMSIFADLNPSDLPGEDAGEAIPDVGDVEEYWMFYPYDFMVEQKGAFMGIWGLYSDLTYDEFVEYATLAKETPGEKVWHKHEYLVYNPQTGEIQHGWLQKWTENGYVKYEG